MGLYIGKKTGFYGKDGKKKAVVKIEIKKTDM